MLQGSALVPDTSHPLLTCSWPRARVQRVLAACGEAACARAATGVPGCSCFYLGPAEPGWELGGDSTATLSACSPRWGRVQLSTPVQG